MNTILAIPALVIALGLVAAFTTAIPILENHSALAKNGQVTNNGRTFGSDKEWRWRLWNLLIG